MHKPAPSRMNMILSSALAMGMASGLSMYNSTAGILRQSRGPAPAGMKYRYPGVYMPGGDNPNVRPTRIKNPKIAAHMQMMHEKWLAAKIARKAVP